MTKEEFKARESLKQERLNRLYLERVYYTGECRRDVKSVLFSFVGCVVCGVGFSVATDLTLKIVTGIGELAGLTSLGIFIGSGVKDYKNQNAKEAEHTALEAQNPEDIDLEESYKPVLTINHKN